MSFARPINIFTYTPQEGLARQGLFQPLCHQENKDGHETTRL